MVTAASSKKDALKGPRGKLEPLDAKVISDFIYDQTTHVLATKRNLPVALQALVSAKSVVTNAYVDAVVQAGTSPGRGEDGETPLPSLLEQDFEGNWPNPMMFVPPTSVEPVPREASYLAPDPERLGLFEGFTFVFCTSEQQASLELAISLGGGKCPLFLVNVGITPAKDLTDYVTSLAGKGSSGTLSSDSPKGVVVVRLQRKEETAESADWINRFFQDVDRSLDQRSIYQNEFLDAILTKNTSALKKPLEFEDEEASSAAARHTATNQTFNSEAQSRRPSHTIEEQSRSQQVSQNQSVQPSADSQPWEVPASRSRSRRMATRSRFKGFDDFDDDDIIQAEDSPHPEPSQAPDFMDSEPKLASNQQAVQASSNHNETQQSQGLFVRETQPAEASITRKRPAQTRVNETSRDAPEAMDDLFPGTRAMKKRRLEQGGAARLHAAHEPIALSSSRSPSPTPAEDNPKGKNKGKAKASAEGSDIRARAREHANQIDKLRDENLDDDPGSVSQLKDLALVEEIDVPRLHSSRAGQTGRDDERTWDSAWSGRKNFKRFRRKGDSDRREYNQGTRVIVPLEAVEERDYGIGDRYWMSFPSSGGSSIKKKKGARSQSQSQGQAAFAGRDERGWHDEEEAEREDVEADEAEMARLGEVLPDELAGPQREGWVTSGLERTTGSRSIGNESRWKQGDGKRSASGALVEPPAKRRSGPSTTVAKETRRRGHERLNLQPVDEEDEDSDEDELKFRLR